MYQKDYPQYRNHEYAQYIFHYVQEINRILKAQLGVQPNPNHRSLLMNHFQPFQMRVDTDQNRKHHPLHLRRQTI